MYCEMTYVEVTYYLGTESSFFSFHDRMCSLSVSSEYKYLRTEFYVEECTTEIPQQKNRASPKREKSVCRK